MRKLVLAMFMSLDGYVAGPNGEFVPPRWSGDVERHWSGYNLEHAGHLLYGRLNFQFNAKFWSDPNSPAAKMPHAQKMNAFSKTVVSKSLTGDVGWNGTATSDLNGSVAALKQMDGLDIFSFGGAKLGRSLIESDLVDEYRLLFTPDLLGSGTRLFEPPFEPQALELIASVALDTGAVISHYRRIR